MQAEIALNMFPLDGRSEGFPSSHSSAAPQIAIPGLRCTAIIVCRVHSAD